MSAPDGLGVIEREIARGKKWEDRGLADPVKVVSTENLTRNLGLDGGVEGQRQAREELDAWFKVNGDAEKPWRW